MHSFYSRRVGLSAVLISSIWFGSVARGQVPGGCDTPVRDRQSDVGCYVSATETLGALANSPVFWHLYNYPSKGAAESARPVNGTVIEAFARVWLFAIADETWHAEGGVRVAKIGPLKVEAGRPYIARYMEATFSKGMHARAHSHGGPEAFYVVSGSQCLETSRGMTTSKAGESAIAPEGEFMTVGGVGTETRRALVVVLHDAEKPWQTLTADWKPRGLCPD